MQINPRTITRLVRLGSKAFRAFQSSRKSSDGGAARQHAQGSPGTGTGPSGSAGDDQGRSTGTGGG